MCSATNNGMVLIPSRGTRNQRETGRHTPPDPGYQFDAHLLPVTRLSPIGARRAGSGAVGLSRGRPPPRGGGGGGAGGARPPRPGGGGGPASRCLQLVLGRFVGRDEERATGRVEQLGRHATQAQTP
jgi:hypothetical protein